MEEIKEKPIGVYIKIDEENNIVEINSEIFIEDFSNWIKIDEGYGDKYAHAQVCYFEKRLIDMQGNYNYQYVDGEIIGD